MSIKERFKARVMREFFKTRSYRKRNVIDDLVTDRPFDFSPPWEKTFFDACRCSFEHHSKNSDFYRRLCAEKKFDKARLRSFEDIWDIPYILCDVFKHYLIETKTGPLRTEFNSSGTSGKKSRIMVDMLSGQRLLTNIYHIYRTLGLASDRPANYIMLAYNPDVDDTVATTNSDVVISYLAPRKELFYALDLNEEGRMAFLKDKTVGKLKAFVDEGLPVRILGFIHHACEVIMAYVRQYGKVRFPPGSCILTGGGWKGAVNPYGADFDYLKFLETNTDIDLRNVRDLYTLNEHMVFYLQCSHRNMHIPNVSLVCARDAHTLERLPDGETGLIHLYSPLIESAPVLSLLTSDYGCVGGSCTCQIGGPYIKVTGRAGLTKKVTCAFTADQYVREPAGV